MLEKYKEKIDEWIYKINSGEIKTLSDFPKQELKEIQNFFYCQEEPLTRIYANFSHLLDSWEILNNHSR